jgi:hypothetical protein
MKSEDLPGVPTIVYLVTSLLYTIQQPLNEELWDEVVTGIVLACVLETLHRMELDVLAWILISPMATVLICLTVYALIRSVKSSAGRNVEKRNIRRRM